jgi:hypothetical protein
MPTVGWTSRTTGRISQPASAMKEPPCPAGTTSGMRFWVKTPTPPQMAWMPSQ